MPHQCTQCEEIYEDGSSELLSGCSECGGDTFQHITVDQKKNTKSDIIDADSNTVKPVEDSAQTNARTTTVSEEELEKYNRRYRERQSTQNQKRSEVTNEDIPDNPPMSVERDVTEIKEMLNSQFEGIRVIEKGKYELNLTQLFERETQVISIKEDGKYVINVPETFDSFAEKEQ